jgi:hypothetical protein
MLILLSIAFLLAFVGSATSLFIIYTVGKRDFKENDFIRHLMNDMTIH